MPKLRVDQALLGRGLAESREAAQGLIARGAGAVRDDGVCEGFADGGWRGGAGGVEPLG